MNQPITIMIAEENPARAEILRHLESHGFALINSGIGAAALNTAREKKPDLIISDIDMPDMDGFEFCRLVKAEPVLAEIPFILLTSLSNTRDVLKGLECGADSFIMKPYTGEHLLLRIQDALSNRELRRASHTPTGVEIDFGGQRFVINSDRQQILDLLLSSYETAVHKNQELGRIQHELAKLNESLEQIVEQRTTALRAEVAQRKLAQDTLREKAQLLDLASDAIMAIDDNLKIVYWNAGAERLYGWSKAEAIGKEVTDLLQFTHDKPLEELREQLLREGSWQGEEHDVRRDGTPITVDSRWTLYRRPHTFPLNLVINTDVTERKYLESQLRQSHKMEAIGRLAGGIAHDFNNLLTVIMGRGQLLLETVKGEKEQRDLTLICSTAARAASLTHQLLAFSRNQLLQPRIVDLNDLVANMERMLTRLIGEDTQLILRCAPDLNTVKADPGQIEQVIMNLVVNARDAMSYGGLVTIETANVDLDDVYVRQHVGARPGRYAMLAVSDNGCGMSPETQAHIFEPFFTTKEQGKGTGLGLSTVYGIVKQSGGYIWAYSEVGRGTSVKVYLPFAEGKLEPIVREVRQHVGGSETVLLVEEDNGVRELIREILEGKGYQVIQARHGVEAIEKWDRHTSPIHLVMTGMQGGSLIQQIRKRDALVKVVYMSGYTDAGIINSGILEEGSDILQKPITADSLLLKIREVLDQ